ncbi:MAG: glycine cleavage system protein GcvH [Candidatus Poseidoniaceae archaeon]|nr:glycine cleavage system protein GcvH [Candidatus Poseidoniaceae archaeon]
MEAKVCLIGRAATNGEIVSEVPLDVYYTKEHEWIKVSDEGEVVIGITDHAQDALTDIVYIELPESGGHYDEMDEIGIVESVKSASPIFAPLAGTITAVNDTLEDAPEQINQEPYGNGWIVRMKLDDKSAVDGLMSASDYSAMISE